MENENQQALSSTFFLSHTSFVHNLINLNQFLGQLFRSPAIITCVHMDWTGIGIYIGFISQDISYHFSHHLTPYRPRFIWSFSMFNVLNVSHPLSLCSIWMQCNAFQWVVLTGIGLMTPAHIQPEHIQSARGCRSKVWIILLLLLVDSKVRDIVAFGWLKFYLVEYRDQNAKTSLSSCLVCVRSFISFEHNYLCDLKLCNNRI